MDAKDRHRVKERSSLSVDPDGWPPVSSEGLWDETLGNDEVRIDNTPWFVRTWLRRTSFCRDPSADEGDAVTARSGQKTTVLRP
jgi:hypothetical protein